MKQMQKQDSLKLNISLISKLKNREKIDLNNKLLSIDIGQIQNRELKLMIQIQAINHNDSLDVEVKEVQKKVREMVGATGENSQERRRMNLLLVKVLAIGLMKVLKRSQEKQIGQNVEKVVKDVNNLQEMRYLLKILFKINSLYQLSVLKLQKINKLMLTMNQKSTMLQIIAMVWLSTNQKQGKQLLQKIQLRKNVTAQDLISKTKGLQLLIKKLYDKECTLLKAKHELEQVNQRSQSFTESEKKLIGNSLQCFRLDLQDTKINIFAGIDKLEQFNYLYASALTQLYFEDNGDVVAKVRDTQFVKNVLTSKSFILQNNDGFSDKPNRLRMSNLSRIQSRPKKNSKIYPSYIETTQKNNEKFITFCKQGEYFTKFNFHNDNQMNKFVRLTEQELRWADTKDKIDSKTHWKIDNVLGIVYGKITHAHFVHQNPSNLCFSIILKERSLDLAMTQEGKSQNLMNFIRGANTLINEYHNEQKEKIKKKMEELPENKKDKRKQLEEQEKFHTLKIQKMNPGKYLWKELIMSLNNKIQSVEVNSFLKKTQGIKAVAGRLQEGKEKSLIK